MSTQLDEYKSTKRELKRILGVVEDQFGDIQNEADSCTSTFTYFNSQQGKDLGLNQK
jgi:hypothetical protein